jgi:hypothetical protein
LESLSSRNAKLLIKFRHRLRVLAADQPAATAPDCRFLELVISQASSNQSETRRNYEMSQEWNPPPPPIDAPTNIPNYLIPAILSLFCCWPLSIVAIIFAAQVNGKVAAGDIPGALDASKKAKLFSFIAIGVGLAVGIVYVLLTLLGVGLGALNSR